MLDLLAANPVLTVFLVVAAGSLLGMVPFGPIRFGPAGALFVGLALGALDPRLGLGLELVRTIGLALFVYTVGLAAGPTLIRTFRRQAPMMVGSAVVLLLVGLTIVVTGALLGVRATSSAARTPVWGRAPRRWPRRRRSVHAAHLHVRGLGHAGRGDEGLRAGVRAGEGGT